MTRLLQVLLRDLRTAGDTSAADINDAKHWNRSDAYRKKPLQAKECR